MAKNPKKKPMTASTINAAPSPDPISIEFFGFVDPTMMSGMEPNNLAVMNPQYKEFVERV
jgi:hypothetical protein